MIPGGCVPVTIAGLDIFEDIDDYLSRTSLLDFFKIVILRLLRIAFCISLRTALLLILILYLLLNDSEKMFFPLSLSFYLESSGVGDPPL